MSSMRSSDRSTSRPKQSATAATASSPPRIDRLPNMVRMFPSAGASPFGPRSKMRALRFDNVSRPLPGSGSFEGVAEEERSGGFERPSLLAVDDDPAVLRAVQRDLRRRYGEHYRVAEGRLGRRRPRRCSSSSSCAASRWRCALADQRMPGMSGVELLEEARSLYPTAKRVLLTAYADTEAAIKAINDVSLDYYLLKPWDPPEEQLYPVVDDLLDDWRRRRDRPSSAASASWAHRWSRERARAPRLSRPQPGAVPLARRRARRRSDAAARAGRRERRPPAAGPLPRRRRVLERPTALEVAEKVGLTHRAPSARSTTW